MNCCYNDAKLVLLVFSSSISVVSAIFLIWALANTMTKNSVDLGIISFTLSFFAGLFVVKRVNTGKSINKSEMILATIPYGVVALNYLLGVLIMTIYFKQRTGFIVYCSIFTLLWTGFGIIQWMLIQRFNYHLSPEITNNYNQSTNNYDTVEGTAINYASISSR
uniref:Uncharacterized protein n=1 Tax=Eucampia antarctica TaxID=49252 RepID=A0A7S2VYM2_9STRA|mmetsp:Transcript_10720/g.10251  ORF Transcript_10720/g.10251 Transcript_10720/m.10251 type:complete len:164 (+) Transcript_10720:46-537(+)